MAASPYGFWTSPITSDLIVADSIRLEQVALDGDAIYWTETQPQKQGRTFVYRVGADGEPERVTPDDANAFSVRARAHEYGGGAFAVSEGDMTRANGGPFAEPDSIVVSAARGVRPLSSSWAVSLSSSASPDTE